MYKIVPTLLVPDEATFSHRLQIIEPFTDVVQIDILNNTFIDRLSFSDPKKIAKMHTPLKFDLHVMTAEPAAVVEAWRNVTNVTRVIFHFESVNDPVPVIQAIRSYKWEVGMAINPETHVSALDPYIEKIDVALFMGVHPGVNGVQFIPETIQRVREFVTRQPRPFIGVDGGVNHDTIRALRDAGTEIFYTGSEIFEKHANVEEAMRELRGLLEA